jgi:hypothetical protein
MNAFTSQGSSILFSARFLTTLLTLLILTTFDATSQTSRVIGWGLNENGQATPPAGLSDAVSVGAQFRNSYAVRANGTIIGWGNSPTDPPVVPLGLTNIAALSCRGGRNLALRSNGTVVAWSFFEPTLGQRVPVGLSNVTSIAEDGAYSLALKSDGTVVSWNNRTNVPPGLSNVIAIAAASQVSLAARSDGTVVAWDRNGVVMSGFIPTGLSNVVALAASHADYCMALKSDGTVVTWGASMGGVGPVPAGLSNVVAISAYTLHALALKSDGTVVAWGQNTDGQNNVPSRATNVTAIAVGFGHMLAVARNTVAPWPRITEQPDNQRALVGQPVKLSANAEAFAPLSYRWQFRGRDIPNASNAILRLDHPQFSDSGDYAVIVTADGLSVRSAPAFLAVNNPPVAQAQTSLGLEDSDLIINLEGFDPSGLPLTMQIVELPAAGRLFQFDANGRSDPIEAVPAAVMDPTWRVIYVPDASGNGPEFDTFLFTVGNEIGESLPATVRIDITPVNDAPGFVKGPDLVVPEDAGPQVVSGWGQGVSTGPMDEIDQRLSFIVSNDNPDLFSVQPEVSAEGTLTFLSAPNAHGTATVTARLMDDGGTAEGGADTSKPQTFIIRVSPVNDAPTARVLADGLAVFPPAFEHPVLISCNWWNSCLMFDGSMSSDPENDALSYLWFVEPEPAPFSASTATTNCFEVGTHTVILTVTDSAGLSDTDSLVFEVVTAPLAIELLIEEINEAHKTGVLLSRKIKRKLTATLRVAFNHASREQLRETQKALDAFEKKVRAQLAANQPTAATAWIRWSQAMSEGVQNCIRPPRNPKDADDGHDGKRGGME